jgi:hypothetical protein
VEQHLIGVQVTTLFLYLDGRAEAVA